MNRPNMLTDPEIQDGEGDGLTTPVSYHVSEKERSAGIGPPFDNRHVFRFWTKDTIEAEPKREVVKANNYCEKRPCQLV